MRITTWAMSLLVVGCGIERLDFTPERRDAGSVSEDAGTPPSRRPTPVVCIGNVTGCAGLDPRTCESLSHCTYANECAPRLGFRCSSLRDEGECRQVPGCHFDDIARGCTGVLELGACERLGGPSCDVAAACERPETPGCVVRQGCVHLAAAECETVPGCTLRCPAGDSVCGELCVDLSTNPDHCGACGASCPGVCRGGACYAYGACTSDLDCASFDDANPCTGTVVCVGGGCQRTPAVVCDDGVECSSDRCDPVTGACRHDPRDGFCPYDQACRTTTGCEAAPTCDGICAVGEECASGPTQTFCRPQGRGGLGAVCDHPLDCIAGLECINLSSRGDFLGVCGRSCSETVGCPSGEVCLGAVCSMRCSPLPSDEVCAPGLRCDIALNDDVTVCLDGRSGAVEGAGCVGDFDCAAGHLCVTQGATGACRQACDRDGARVCPSSFSCLSLSPPHEAYGREYGVCIPR